MGRGKERENKCNLFALSGDFIQFELNRGRANAESHVFFLSISCEACGSKCHL